MSDKPILFSAPMVRALLAGTKTQTRRTISTKQGRRPNLFDGTWADEYVLDPGNEDWRQECLRIKAGDRLWVKETSRITSWSEDGEVWITYAADEAKSYGLDPDDEEYLERLCARVEKAGAELNADGMYTNIPPAALVKPSIFMPRWASRMTLTVTDVRVQRLQDISGEDALAEGVVTFFRESGRLDWPAAAPGDVVAAASELLGGGGAVAMYRDLWNAINGPDSWDANPWVAAYTFTVEHANIDQLARAAA